MSFIFFIIRYHVCCYLLPCQARAFAAPDNKKMAKAVAKRSLRGSLDDLLAWCPDPSLCAFDPFRVKPRPK